MLTLWLGSVGFGQCQCDFQYFLRVFIHGLHFSHYFFCATINFIPNFFNFFPNFFNNGGMAW